MSIRVPRNRPLLALLVTEALASDSRRAILRELLASPDGMMASELAKRLGLTLPTILSHIDKLAAAGLVRAVPYRRGGKVYKKYRAAGRRVAMDVDLALLSSIPPREVLEKKLASLVDKAREKGELPETMDPASVKEVLGVDLGEAVILADYYNMSRDRIVDILVGEAEKLFQGKSEVQLSEIEEKLRVTTYWAVKVASRLEELGIMEVKY